MGTKSIAPKIILTTGSLLYLLAASPAVAQPNTYLNDVGTNGIPTPTSDGIPPLLAQPGGTAPDASSHTQPIDDGKGTTADQSPAGPGASNSDLPPASPDSGDDVDPQDTGTSAIPNQK
ncbi:MAG: hypothetical protein M0006_09635 [Magnetospirillum sp.]|nr:hypothetical protein [Magnetospirillum sp.]